MRFILSKHNATLLFGLIFSACTADEKEPTDSPNDTSSQNTPIDDLDGDGIADEDDDDADGDGVIAEEDCDDRSADLLSMSEDMDCDGVLNVDDTDADGDGIDREVDCDDLDTSAGSSEADVDCDGISTDEDCDDTDAEAGSQLADSDCDGHLTDDDCDDEDAGSTHIAEDSDCDGISNSEDAFPDDATESADSDQDGVGDNSDLCEGSDDSIDEDENGTPDGCDIPGWANCDTNRSVGEAKYQFIGENEFDGAGASLSFVGDVDGDGFDDILIGARPSDDYQAGKAYLFLTSSMGSDGILELAAADYIFAPEQVDDYFGSAVAAAGDVDGDGLGDLLFGAYMNDSGTTNSGKAYLVLGASLGSDQNINIADADTTFVSDEFENYVGSSLAHVGDIDGDGLDDILIAGKGQNQAGATYLIFGSSLYSGEFNVADADYTFYSIGGVSDISSAGDVDGDGVNDFLIGNQHESTFGNNSGESYILLSSSLGAETEIDLDDADYVFQGGSSFSYTGAYVSTAGDVDGDGLSDILISYHYLSLSGAYTYEGGVYLILGSSLAAGPGGVMSLSESDYFFEGVNPGDSSGSSLASAGDIDGDGLDDILIGSGGGAQDAGAVQLILGSSLGSPGTISLSATDYTLMGENAGDHSILTSPIVGDVDGDGVPDILVGGPNNDAGGENSGRIVLFGNCE